MSKRALTGWAAAAGIGVIVACSSSNSSTNNNLFPFSGPSCPSGTQASAHPGTPASAACNQCNQAHCSGASQCVATDCANFFQCICPCKVNDYNCISLCFQKFDQTCQSCLGSVSQCASQNCGNECSAGLDAGSSSD